MGAVEELGVSAYISSIERGVYSVNDVVERLAEALGVEAEELLRNQRRKGD